MQDCPIFYVLMSPSVSLQDENDVYILTKVSDILHSVFSSYKEKVLPWFEQLLQLIVQLIVSISVLKQAKAPLISCK